MFSFARMTSIDRISFRTIATSVDIQEGLRARGFKVVKDPRSVKSHVLAFADEIKMRSR
ncbi:Putative AC9 transposase [Caligus rogercresseyi]|uniref:AC9 transposase n=1 Tax=Caligus rogercresseyi TaxID=217165 RepID=A0A7T8GUJ0_CALRO|nr:Putative AC9 transposase [Caligus rogercresseyi]